MKLRKILWSLLFSVLVLSACEDKQDGFSGLSNLVEKRNEVRQTLSDKNAREKALQQQSNVDSKKAVALDEEKKKAEVSPFILYERDVEVVDSSNRKSLAKGVAYLNKEGQIVKITITKE